jgi:hypothetical protein
MPRKRAPLVQLPMEDTGKPPIIDYDDDTHRYWIDKIEVPSVSAILDSTTPKPALPWWGMRVGLAAIVKLLQEGSLSYPVLASEDYHEVLSGVPTGNRIEIRKGKEKTRVEAAVINAKLDTNSVKEEGGVRGTAIHEAVEIIGTHDRIPDMQDYPVHLRGYIRAISSWWLDQEPEIHRQEVIVGSRKNGYAGRFDLDASYSQYGRTLTDFKTAKGIYDGNFEQLRLYADAEKEMSGLVFDDMVVVRLGADGTYEMQSGKHVSSKTVTHLARLHHQRLADAERKKR